MRFVAKKRRSTEIAHSLRSSGALLARLTSREITDKTRTGPTTVLWLIVNPVLLLGVYGFVFGVIFEARAPADLDVPFVAWLAVALWPWLAFSDGALRGSQAILQHSALISKVALPRHLLTGSTQTAAFILQLLGYAVILIVLTLLGIDLSLVSLPYLLFVLATLYLFSLGLGLLLSALQVFVRDLEPLLPTFFLFWFFLTPILYSPEIMPDFMSAWLSINPMNWWITEVREALFNGKSVPDSNFLFLVTGSLVSLWAGFAVFNRLSPYFEDFL